MHQALRQHCQVDDAVLLTNQRATRAAIENAILRDLASKSQPGDTVFIYFSCHGGRTSDTDGDEPDGLDEYLVTFDSILGQPETMLLDDQFARWIRELDGRRVVVILDNCYAGGSSKTVKGIAEGDAGSRHVDFIDGEMSRAKSVGQSGIAVLAACQANQLAWEMPSLDDGSVFTYHVLRTLREAAGGVRIATDKDRILTLNELYRCVKAPVENYVWRTFSARQTPVLLEDGGETIVVATIPSR
jgi:uncharacterized caspase-like protein